MCICSCVSMCVCVCEESILLSFFFGSSFCCLPLVIFRCFGFPASYLASLRSFKLKTPSVLWPSQDFGRGRVCICVGVCVCGTRCFMLLMALYALLPAFLLLRFIFSICFFLSIWKTRALLSLICFYCAATLIPRYIYVYIYVLYVYIWEYMSVH